jgi:hypothetical protein
VILSGYNFNLYHTIFSSLVFEFVHSLEIELTIGPIQENLFKSFKHIDTFNVYLNNLGNFFHKLGIEWAFDLPNESHIEFFEIKNSTL